MTLAAQQARVTPERAGKKISRTRDASGRFALGCAPGPGRRPTDPTLKALAAADRERNFGFIRSLRDDRKADMELRFEAAKLLASYSDGKPLTAHVGAPLVNLNFGMTPATPGDQVSQQEALAYIYATPTAGDADYQRALEVVTAPSPVPPLLARDAGAREAIDVEATAVPARASPAPAPSGEAGVMVEADVAPQVLPPAVQAVRDEWIAARARGQR